MFRFFPISTKKSNALTDNLKGLFSVTPLEQKVLRYRFVTMYETLTLMFLWLFGGEEDQGGFVNQ